MFVCSGLLFWTLSDSWGIHNWSLIDYYLDKKPIYYALKRAMCPIEISVRGYCAQSFEGMRDYRSYFAGAPAPLEIWLSNDTLQEESLTARYTVCDFDGHILFSGEKNVKLAPNISAAVTTVPVAGLIPLPERTVLHAEVFRGEELLSDTDYFFAPYKELDLRQAAVTWHTDVPGADGSMLLHLTADSLVWMAHIGGTDRIDVSDNDFHMLPGKEYVITVRPRGRDCPGFGQNGSAGFVPELHSAGTEPRAVQG